MPDFATFRYFAMPEYSGIFRWDFPPDKMPPHPDIILEYEFLFSGPKTALSSHKRLAWLALIFIDVTSTPWPLLGG